MARDSFDESKNKKKKDEKKTVATKPQSSSVKNVNQKANKSTFLGGGAPVNYAKTNQTKKKTPTVTNKETANNAIQRSNKSTFMGGVPATKSTQPGTRREEAVKQKMTGGVDNSDAARERRVKRYNVAQAQKSGDFDRASELHDELYGKSKIRTQINRWDKDITDTITHTVKQGLAADARVANLGMKGITQKDAFLYTTPEQRRKADEKVARRDEKLGKRIETETKAIQDIQNRHGYLGKQALSAVSSTTGMGMDIAAGAIIPGSSLFHMWARSTGTSLGEVNKRADNLRKQLKSTGQYSDSELYEMFRNVDALDMANAAASGGVEVLSELLFPGMGAARKVIGGKGMSIAERAGAKLFNRVGEKAAGGLLRNVARGTGEEVLEEEIGGPLQSLASNLIYGNRFQEYNEEAVKRSLAEQSSALRSNIRSEADAQAASARLSSKAFMDESVKSYMQSGYSKEEATKLAEMSRDYLTASLSGDVDAMKKYQDDMVNVLAGGENSQKQKFGLQDAIDAAVSTSMMTIATGMPAAVSTMQIGNSYKQSAGLDAIKQQAEMIKNWETDPKEKERAQAIIDHIDKGGDLSGTQVYEIVQKTGELAESSKQPEQLKNRMAQVEMQKRDLRISPVNPDGTLAPQTSQRFERIVSDTISRHEALARIGEDDEYSASDVAVGANIGAAFNTGVINAEMVNELARGSEGVKAVFKEVTGIDTKQFDSYSQMNDALMARAADNMVNSARLEQVAWNDESRKQLSDYLRSDIGSKGDIAIQNALESVDPRDRTQFLMTGDVSRNVYEFARRTDGTWNEARARIKEMYPSVNTNILRQVFDAAKQDKEIAETKAYGKVVTSGKEMNRNSLSNAETAFVPGVFNDRRTNKEGATLSEESLLKSFVSAFGINIDLVDSLGSVVRDKDGNVVLDEEGNPLIRQDNGMFDPSTNTLTVNANADTTRTITQTAVHELTHHIAVHAPEEYVKLSRYIMDAWYRQDAEGYTRAIKQRQALYKAQKNQELSDEQALEEIIADGAADFNWADADFIAEVTSKEPTLASKIIDAIKEVLRKLRSILASGDVIDEQSRNALYDKVVEFDTVRSLWVKAAQTARKAQADQAIDDWQDRANKQNSPRLSANEASNETNETRFSLSGPVERVADLIAVHNLKPEDIRNTFELGGFPMPSIAVTKDSMGHDLYGDITLMFNSDTIDPRFFRSNQVFGGDAYTPTFPATQYKPNEDIVEKFRDIYYDNAKTLGYDAMRPFYELAEDAENALNRNGGEQGLIDRYKNDIRAMRTFLKINGKDVEDVVKRTEDTISETEQKLCQHFIDTLGEDAIREFEGEAIPHGKAMMDHRKNWTYDHSDEIKSAYKDFLNREFSFSDEEISNVLDNMSLFETMKLVRNALNYLNNGPTTVKEEVDRAATDKAIEDAAHELGYEEWIDGLLTGIEEKRGIRNDKEFFTRNGNRRSWDTLHDDITLENVVKAMRSELAAGGNGFLWKNPKGAAQKQYKSLDEIRADEDRLQQLPEEEYKALEQAATQKLSDVLSDVVDNNPGRFMNSFGAVLDTGEYIAEILNETRDKATMQRKLKKDYSLDVSDEQMDRIAEAIDEIANIPTGYFEAKPRRAVGFDEVKAAIIPQNIDEDIKVGLSERGISSYEYDPDVEGDRTQKINDAASENDLRFSISVKYDDAYMDAVNSNNMDEAQRLVDEAAKEAGYTTKAYHGTGNRFTVFDKEKSGKNYRGYSKYGKGLYFADSIEQANHWGKNRNLLETYLDLKNPYVVPLVAKEGDILLEEYNKHKTAQDTRLKPSKEEPGAFLFEMLNGMTDDKGFTTKFLQDRGYDGVIAEHVAMADMPAWTEYVVFEPEQIKSADPVTYAEDGSVITLSERFDPANNDIRYSLPTQDSDGNILTDGQMEYFKNSQARDSQGRLVPVYHTTNKGGFTVFDPSYSDDKRSLFFAEDWDTSQTYGNYANSRFYYFDIDNIDDVQKYLDAYSPDRYFVTQEQFDQAGGWEADMLDFENVTNGEQSDFAKYLDNPDGYIAIIGVPDYSPDNTSYADTWVMAKSPDELVRELHNHFGWQRDNYKMGTQHGYYACYLNLEDPYIIDAHGDNWNEIHLDDYDDDVTFDTRAIAEMAMDMDFDGVVIRNLVDHGGKSPYDGMFDYSDIYIAFSSNQVKDINNENPTENPDIRYSIPPKEDVLDYIASTVEDINDIPLSDAALEQSRQEQSEWHENLVRDIVSRFDEGSLTFGMYLDEGSVKKHLIALMKQVMSESGTGKKYRTETLESTIESARVMFYDMKNRQIDNAAEAAWRAAQKIVDDIDYNDDLYVQYKGIRQYLDRRKIIAPEGLEYDPSFVEFVDDNKGRMRFVDSSKKGTSVDTAYKYLVKNYPQLFPADMEDPIDKLLQIDYALDYTTPYRDAYSSEEYSKLVATIAGDLMKIVSEGEAYRTVADDLTEKYEGQIKAMKVRHEEALRKVKETEKEKRDATRQTWAKIAQRWKDKYNERIQKDKEERKAKADKREHLKSFGHIEENYKKLCTWVLKPTKEKNVPEEFRKALAEFLQALDLQTENSKALEAKTGKVAQKTLKMRELKDRLNDLAARKGEDGSSVWEVDASIAFLLEKLSNKLDENGNSIDALSVDDIATIDEFMKLLIRNIQRYKQVKTETKMAELSDVGGRGVEFFQAKIDRDGTYRKRKGLPGTIAEINATALTPAYLFDRMGPLKEMYDVLRHNGFDTYIRNEKMIMDRLTGILGQYYKTNKKNQNMPGSIIEEWRDERSAQTIELASGKTVTMSIAQIMSLRCLAKRGEQAMGHMMVGGIVVEPIQTTSKLTAEEKKKKGKAGATATRTGRAVKKWLKERTKGEDESSQKYVLTYEDILNIISKLTPEQANVADQLQKLMSVDMAKLGNEAHRELYGYEMFEEGDYFPIKVHGNERATDVNNIGEVIEKIKSFGFTKPLTPKASQAIDIGDIFSIVADHCNGMNLYNAYLVPITDFMKVLNYTHTFENGDVLTMKEAIEQAYGKDMLKYILNLMKDINGIKGENRGGLEGIMNKALGIAKRTAVFGNIRVALQQPTAIVRAFAEIDVKYIKGALHTDSLTGFVPTVETKTMQEMWKYCPISQWKAWGYYDTYMGRDIEDVMMNTWSIGDKFLAGYYGQLDNATWSIIWQAVKAEQAEKHPKMDHNSEEFLQLCGRRASEVFDKTQVVDSTFHRSDAMRSKQVAAKVFTAFMAEPTLTLNVFRAGLFNANEAKKEGNKAEAHKILRRAISVIVVQAIVVSAAQAFADAWRGKGPGLPWDDDDDEEKIGYWWRWIHNFTYNLFDQAHLENNMYLVKDVTPYINYIISKGADYADYKLEEGGHEKASDVLDILRAVMGWDQDYLYSQNNLVFAGLENTANGIGQAFKKLEKGDEYVDYNTKEPKSWYDINQKVASGIGTFTGFPAGTLMRDFKPIWDKIIPTVFAADTELMDNIANKMGYQKIGSGSTDKTSSSISESEGTSYSMTEDDLPDNLTDEQKKEIIKAGEKRAKKNEGKETETTEQLDYDKMLYDAMKAAAGLEGEEYNKKVYSTVANGLKSYIAEGDYTSIGMMRTVIEQAGGDVEYFDKRVLEETKTAYKKTLTYSGDMTSPEGIAARNDQKAMFRYMMSHGMTQEELSSEILYKSDLAKDMKVAYRIGDNEMIYEAMLPLVDAGITKTDLERIYDNRNRMDLTKYSGRYKDRLKSTGKFIWPASGPLTSHFGYRNAPTAGASSNHPAIDIGVPVGTSVVAADGGVIIYAGRNSGYGNSVGIKHDNGMVTYYNHLDSWNVKVGDTVAQGQQIALSGNTGISTGPHLDFKILDAKGNPVDPEKYLN